MEKAYEEIRNGCNISIYHDDGIGGGPDEWKDEGLFLVGFHRDFTVDRESYTQELVASLFDKNRYEDGSKNLEAVEVAKQYNVFPLEAYIHSGVVLALQNEGNFPDRQWDVSLIGAVFISKKEAKTKMKARKLALTLIKTWNDYLSGNVYGFQVEDNDGNDVDSCWGFYGDYEKSGILDEARSIADYHAKKERAKHEKKLRAMILHKVSLDKREESTY